MQGQTATQEQVDQAVANCKAGWERLEKKQGESSNPEESKPGEGKNLEEFPGNRG